MKVMDVLKRIKDGEQVMVTLPSERGKHKRYTLTDGTEVSREQMLAIKHFLKPSQMGLFEGSEPQSYVWEG